MIKRNVECLLLELQDKRRFLTSKKNYHQLLEFINTFHPKVSVVLAPKTDVLTLEQLAQGICSNESGTQIKVKNKILKSKSALVQADVRRAFLKGQIVSLQEMTKKHNLSLSAVCNYMGKVRRQLGIEGYHISKVAPGKYRIS